MTLTNLRKKDTIRTSINYRCVPGKQEPGFVGDGLEYKGNGCTILYNPAKIQ